MSDLDIMELSLGMAALVTGAGAGIGEYFSGFDNYVTVDKNSALLHTLKIL